MSALAARSPVRPRLVHLPGSPSVAGPSQHRSPPTTPKQLTVLPLPSSDGQSACRLLVPQLLSRSELTCLVTQPHSPHPLLLCTQCLLPVSSHSQQLHSTASAVASALQSGKLLNDPIHGHIHVDDDLVAVIDTPHFQRLRDLKQLGTSYFVFPGACHNRFEHSIGVAHLAAQLVDHLIANQPELDIAPKERFLVTLAGLCHDLGHGPFSHVFDSEFIPAAIRAAAASGRPTRLPAHWQHEQASIMMTEDMLAAAGRHLDEADMQFVRELINPTGYQTRSNPKLFLYDIVANARNSLDVDKFDYLARDSHQLGIPTALRHERLVKNCRVIDNEICFNSKEIFNIYESLFHTRYSLHKQVYSHRVSKAVEYMLCDVLLLADPVLRLSDAILSAPAYCRLTDCVLKQIECSTEPELQEARALIHRIRTRRLYRLVEESIIPTQLADMPDVTVADILACAPAAALDACGLLPCDVQVQNLRMSYAMKDANPVDHVRFFDKVSVNVSYRIPKSKVSHVMPERFSERILRVYIKDIEEQRPAHSKPKFDALKAATTDWLKQHNCLSPLIKRTASGVLSRKPSFLHRSPAKPAASTALPQQLPDTAASIAEGREEPSEPPERRQERQNNNGETATDAIEQRGERLVGSGDHRRSQPDQQQGQEQGQVQGQGAGAAPLSFASTSSSSSSPSLKRKRSSAALDGDSSSGEWSPVASSAARRRSLAPQDSPSAATRRSSMDPPSPQLLHSAHAPYHYNPTLACHWPTPRLTTPPRSQ